MASTHKHIRSGTANKRPTTAIADGQIALNTNLSSPGLFFKDSTGAEILKIGPVHVGATAPNASPAGSAGNSTGEIWLDTSLTPVGVKIWNGSAFVNATPIGSTTVQGLLELATDAETQAGADTARAITSASLQSKLSDSTSTTSATTIASSTAVKAAYDLANAALPKTGGTVTGNLEIGTAGSLSFEGATADGFETTIAVVDPTADRTITLPNTTGTVVTTGDSGTVTSTMLLDGTIVDADINASAEIAVSKLADGSARQLLQTDAAGTGVEWASNIDIPGTLDVTSAATFDSSVAVTGALTKSGSNVVTVGDTGTVTSTMILDGTILNSDVNASAAIVDTKLATISTAGKVSNSATTATNANTASAIVARDGSGNFTAGTITAALTGAASSNVLKAGDTMTGALVVPLGAVGTPSLTFTGDTNTGIYSPGANQVAVATGGTGRLFVDGNGLVSVVGASTSDTNFTVNGKASLSTSANWNFPGLLLRRTASNIASAKQISFLLDGDTESDTTLTNYLNIWGTYSGPPTTSSTSTGLSASMNLGAPNAFIAHTNGSERLRITPAGLVGIGTSAPGYKLHVDGSCAIAGDKNLRLGEGSFTYYYDLGRDVATGAFVFNGNQSGSVAYVFQSAGTERARIDSSGRLLVGTSSARANLFNATISPGLQLEAAGALGASNRFISVVNNFASNGDGGGVLALCRSKGGTVGSNTVVAADDQLGRFDFQGNDGTEFVSGAMIEAFVDGTPGANDMPGRLVFSTTADGASSPTEAMRIKSTGIINFSNAPTHADNTAATAAGLAVGDVYKTVLGVLMIRF